ncbi:MAG: M24 family metallopeptidase [Patescibacteria group bacterium]
MKSILVNLDAFFITNPTNIRYLTGFVGAAPEEREAFALLLPNETFLFTNSLYMEAALNLKVKGAKLKVEEISREKPIGKQLRHIVKELQIKKLGFEENDLIVAELRKLEAALKGVALIPTKDRVEKLRMIKGEDEIENIRQAAKLTDHCFDFILGKFKPRVSENEIAWEIEAFFRKTGATAAFSPIVAFGKNSSQPHYQISLTRSLLAKLQGETLNKTDIALLDFGARINGYCNDMTRVVFSGKPQEEWQRAYKAVLEAQRRAFDYLNSTKSPSGAAVDRLARKIIKQAGFPPYPHSLGHNVGLEIHEGPRLTIKKDAKLKPGMVVTVEPAIYKEGQYGIRLEDLVLLKTDGIEILSKATKEMIVL